MKRIRKLASLLLVLVMSLALAVPCFAVSTVSAISSEGKKVGDKWTVGDFIIEVIDAEEFYSMTRSGYIFQNEEFTTEVDSSFGWNCGTDPVLSIGVDCAESDTAVEFNLNARIASISDTVAAQTAKFWKITNRNPSNQYITVNFSFDPVSGGEKMSAFFSAHEGN